MASTRKKKPIQPIAFGSRRAFFQAGMSGIARSLATSLLRGAGRRETTCCHGGPLPHGGELFPDAEIAENHVQDILDIDPAGEPPEGARGDAQLLGQ